MIFRVMAESLKLPEVDMAFSAIASLGDFEVQTREQMFEPDSAPTSIRTRCREMVPAYIHPQRNTTPKRADASRCLLY